MDYFNEAAQIYYNSLCKLFAKTIIKLREVNRMKKDVTAYFEFLGDEGEKYGRMAAEIEATTVNGEKCVRIKGIGYKGSGIFVKQTDLIDLMFEALREENGVAE